MVGWAQGKAEWLRLRLRLASIQLLPSLHHGMIGGDHLDRLAATDRLHGNRALNSGQWVRRLLIGGSPHSGAVPRLRG